MTKFPISILSIIILLSTTFSKCNKDPIYQDTPEIDFQQISVKDSTDLLDNKVKAFSIYFKVLDGDGDFGVKENDTLIQYYNDSIYANNFFATLLYLDNGVPTEYDIELSLDGAIPYTAPVGLNVFYKALVIYDLLIPNLPDTLKLKFHIIDRHLHESNDQETPWIAPDFYGIITDTTTVF